MTQLTVELDEDTVRRLGDRALREGLEPAALAGRLLRELSEVDPFEFVGCYESDIPSARNIDKFLSDNGFGTN